MNLYELTNGMVGESYVRCYAWAASEADAIRLALERNPKWSEHAIGCKVILASNWPAFCTLASDNGWEVP